MRPRKAFRFDIDCRLSRLSFLMSQCTQKEEKAKEEEEERNEKKVTKRAQSQIQVKMFTILNQQVETYTDRRKQEQRGDKASTEK